MIRSLIMLLLGSALAGAPVQGSARAKEIWKKIGHLFAPPAELKDDLGAFRSVLQFEDGRAVRAGGRSRPQDGRISAGPGREGAVPRCPRRLLLPGGRRGDQGGPPAAERLRLPAGKTRIRVAVPRAEPHRAPAGSGPLLPGVG